VTALDSLATAQGIGRRAAAAVPSLAEDGQLVRAGVGLIGQDTPPGSWAVCWLRDGAKRREWIDGLSWPADRYGLEAALTASQTLNAR